MDWKEYPNLFTNGKFKVICHQHGYELPIKIEGYENPVNKFIVMEWEKDPKKFNKKYFLPVNDCTLVARRIEDMTDEEINKAPLEHNLHDQSKKWCIHDLRATSDIDVFLYLLSIGVYPFEWDESVIDKKTLTQTV